jgi:hypothetical protein
MNVSPKSCSDLTQVDPRTGVNQGGKNFMTSAQSCHFYEIAECTNEAINSKWAKQKWGDDLDKIRKGINAFLFEKHLSRISALFPASDAVSLEDAKKYQSTTSDKKNTKSEDKSTDKKADEKEDPSKPPFEQ